jgi:hypothetical protein
VIVGCNAVPSDIGCSLARKSGAQQIVDSYVVPLDRVELRSAIVVLDSVVRS